MKILIIIEYQNDFVDGNLGFPKAKELDERIVERIKQYDDIIFTMDTHDENYLTTLEGKNLPVKHCIKGTKGWEVYGKTSEYVSKAIKVFEKPTFPSLELANYLKDKNYDEVELCGLVSNICVLTNVVMVKSALPNAHIIVDKSLTASFDEDLNNKTFDILKGIYVECKEE